MKTSEGCPDNRSGAFQTQKFLARAQEISCNTSAKNLGHPTKSPAWPSGANVSSHDQRGSGPDTRNKPRACDAGMTGRWRLGHQMRRPVASIMSVRTLRGGTLLSDERCDCERAEHANKLD